MRSHRADPGRAEKWTVKGCTRAWRKQKPQLRDEAEWGGGVGVGKGLAQGLGQRKQLEGNDFHLLVRGTPCTEVS